MAAQPSAYSAYKAGNFAEAFSIWNPLAKQGDANAQNNLAMLYVNGRGVEKNSGEAVRWLQKSVDQGNASAQVNLGTLYATGDGVDKNIFTAYQLWSDVTLHNNPIAQANLDQLCAEHSWICHFQSWEASR